MIVISDGDLIRNQLDKLLQPVELGYDQRSGNLYDNKSFMLNCVNYLLDDTDLLTFTAKIWTCLDKEKVLQIMARQVITIGLPLLILVLFGVVFTYLEKRKYGQ
jgi:hypothetical protein